MFAELWKYIPSLALWIESCYSEQLFLLHVQEVIHSCSGIQQSDSWGPLAFALILRPIVTKIQARNLWSGAERMVTGWWYTHWFPWRSSGSPGDSKEGMKCYRLALKQKQVTSLHPTESPLPPYIPITRRGFTLLGCWIGLPEFCEEEFSWRIAKVRTSLNAVHDLKYSQLETTLLCSCLALPKVAFVFWACPWVTFAMPLLSLMPLCMVLWSLY